MKYYDKMIFEISSENRIGYQLPKNEFKKINLPKHLLREEAAQLPEVSELDVARHYTNVSNKNFGVETGFYPLGSCTMKYNPKINDELANLSGFTNLHPLSDPKDSQGILEIYYDLANYLSNITGMDNYSLNSFAGAQGELAGLMIIKKYHQDRNDHKRNTIIIPDSAHGTNPASASVAGFDVVEIKSNHDGTVNLDSLKEVLNDEVAGLMLTNPNTAGVFEKDILEISKLIHDIGGLVYYDGANLNPLLGIARPGDMGFDITHLNLHKTFSTPHGGGGPGSGPVGVKAFLKEYLPGPIVKYENDFYDFYNPTHSIGPISSFYGNTLVYLRAYIYIRTLGKDHLGKVGRLSILNSTYIKESLKDYFKLPIKTETMHEFVFDGLKNPVNEITTLDIAKRLLDFNVHAPTVYFPLIFKQSMMVEPTEVESKDTLDNFINIMKQIVDEANNNPELLKTAPHTTPVRRLDEAKAARRPVLKYHDLLD